MAHEYEKGWVHHVPAWHRLADIKGYRPETWDDAVKGYLDWEPYTEPLYAKGDDGAYRQVPGYMAVSRDDTKSLLCVQQDSYAVIGNGEFGGLIEYAMGVDIPGMPRLQFDALSVLKGGRMVVATLMLEEPLTIPGDDSALYPMMAFWTRHDGTGGMKGGASSIRVVCANTQAMAETQMDQHKFVFTIRHTKNWTERMEHARSSIVTAIANVRAWEEMAGDLAKKSVSPDVVRAYLDRWLPFSTAMTDQQRRNVEEKRSAFWRAYDSATCESISGTAWGVLQASIEAADHYFPAHSYETRTARILVNGDHYKQRALQLVGRL